MKKITILFFCLLFVIPVFAQQKALKITNNESGKEVLIREYKKVKVKNAFGQEFSGRFIAEGDGAISIDGMKIQISNLAEVRRNSIFLSVFARAFLIYGGAVVAGVGIIAGAFGNPVAFVMILPGAAMIYAGIKSSKFSKRYRSDQNWTFELVPVSE